MTALAALAGALLSATAFAAEPDRNLAVSKPAAAAAQVTERRLALVIGNGAYDVSPLRNPVNDARATASALRQSGFQVTERLNLTQAQMRDAIRAFGDQLHQGGVGLFYYAGHGMQVKGRNYLIPVRADIRREDEVADQAVSADVVLQKMESAKNRLNIVILDACRNNPFARSFRSSGQGLAQMDAPSGTLLAYATAPGSVAADGSGNNGLYTQHLLASIRQPGLRIEDVFKRVRVNVKRDSKGLQVPWENTSLEGDFFFKPGQAGAAPPVQVATIAPRLDSAALSSQTTLQKLNNPDFLDELETYTKQSSAPASELRRQADSGDPVGQARWCAVATHERFNLGLRPEEGIGYCRQLAEQGIPVGMFFYGRAFMQGQGVAKDDAEAVKWYRLGAEKSNALAMINLGSMYENGRGVAKDDAEAVKWYRLAAEKGNAHAMTGLGFMYRDGRGVAKDDAEAVKWYRLGAEKGNAHAMNDLGVVHEYGRGVAKDIEEAVMWYRKAKEQGSEEASKNLSRLGR
ncbi:MAG: caspase family protein [Gammaproteobacteria bacterium]|nr:caspase family protein [Gammaproteobacteria bacterium]